MCEQLGDDTLMISVVAAFENPDRFLPYLLNTNMNNSFSFSQVCTQGSRLVDGSSDNACTDYPTYAENSVDDSVFVLATGSEENGLIAGYTVDGVWYLVDGYLSTVDGEDAEKVKKTHMLLVKEINDNQNLYNVSVVAGEVGWGTGSSFLEGLKDENNVTEWLLITNCLSKNTIMEGKCTAKSVAQLYAGPGDYSSLVTFD
jgi:hypothetical protein